MRGSGDTAERLQSDSPADADAFGAHERVAASIFQLITNSEGGKAIALEGSWGAGKSTVIKLLASKCRSSDIAVFIYDAWVHSGDPLRRAFMASLIEDLQRRNWLPTNKKWEDELALVSGKQRRTTRSVTPVFTRFGRLLALSLLGLVPGVTLLGKGVDAVLQAKSFYIDKWSVLAGWLGVALCLMPPLICVIHYVSCLISGAAKRDYFAAVLNKQTDVEAMVVTDSGDPTSIEFQSLFIEALKDALAQAPTRRLVVVIDNLDRLSVEEVQKAWVLLQSFTELSATAHVPGNERLWIVVPVAPTAPAAGEAENSSRNNGATAISPLFLEKVFQARFRLPPPILKNWQPFMDRLLRDGIPAASESDRQQILALYVSLRQSRQMPTPRDIVLFVNQLAIFSAQWRGRYSLAVGAAFTLECSTDALPRLERGDAPSATARRMIATDLKEAFACIYFNTGDAAGALELLQSPVAHDLLERADTTGISARFQEHSSFAPILIRAYAGAADRWVFDSPMLVVKASLAIARAVESSSLGDSPKAGSFLRDVLQAVHGTVAWALQEFRIVPVAEASFVDLSLRLMHQEEGEAPVIREPLVTKSLASALCKSPSNAEAQEATSQELGLYIKSVNSLLANVALRDAITDLGLAWVVPFAPVGFRQLLAALDESLPPKLLAPVGGGTAVADFLETRITKGLVSVDDLVVFDWLVDGRHERQESKVFEAIKVQLTAEDALSSTLAVAIGTLTLSKALRPAHSAIPDLRISLYNAAVRQHEGDDDAGAAMLLLAGISFAAMDDGDEELGEVPPEFRQIASKPKPQLVNGLRKLVLERRLVGILLKAVERDKYLGPIVAAVIADRSELNKDLLAMPDSGLMERVEALRQAFGDKGWELVDQTLRLRMEDESMEGYLCLSVQTQIGRRWISRCFTKGIGDRARLAGEAAQALVALPARAWEEASKVFTWDALLACQLVESGVQIVLPNVAITAIALIGRAAEGNLPWDVSRVAQFLKVLKPAQRHELAKSEAARLTSTTVPASTEYWTLVAPLLDTYLLRPTSQAELLEVARAILGAPSAPALGWLLLYLKSGPGVARSFGDRDVKRALYSIISTSSGSSSPGDPIHAELRKVKAAISRLASGRAKKGRKQVRKVTS
ncbi:P-loop NTPase fold protein [Luteibacter sp. 329MFSha]|uniref:P-loop NTPase fold protein n=1 Tax=Luteibacter sp. 329MFSha TaxID=1798239 RepID=UPI0008B3ECD2|nr:P-loop NTPase fold protein [Luteibacter sp. 329MFSha]SEW06501.1 KAP family P-loop domain-containing protein [Luteibacter sp. 329MFSha]